MNKLLLILITLASSTMQGQWALNVVELINDKYEVLNIGEPTRDCYVVDFEGSVGSMDTYVGQYWLSYGNRRLMITDIDNSSYPTEFYTWTGGNEPVVRYNQYTGFWQRLNGANVPHDGNFNWDCD